MTTSGGINTYAINELVPINGRLQEAVTPFNPPATGLGTIIAVPPGPGVLYVPPGPGRITVPEG